MRVIPAIRRLRAEYRWLGNINPVAINFLQLKLPNGNGAKLQQSQQPGAAIQAGLFQFNRPQRFVFNYSSDLPFGHPRDLVGQLAEGFNVSGLTAVPDGMPLTITDFRAGTIYGIAGPISTSPASTRSPLARSTPAGRNYVGHDVWDGGHIGKRGVAARRSQRRDGLFQ